MGLIGSFRSLWQFADLAFLLNNDLFRVPERSEIRMSSISGK